MELKPHTAVEGVGNEFTQESKNPCRGCLDAVPVSVLLEDLGIRRELCEIPMPSGGWRGSLRRLRNDLDKGIRAIAFIDADQSVEDALAVLLES